MQKASPIIAVACLFALAAHADFDVVITEPSAIATNDTSLDGCAVLVDNTVLTIDGAHHFTRLSLTNGAVMTHTASSSAGLEIRVDGDLYVASDAAIDVSGKGYRGAGAREDGHGPGGGRYGIGASGGGAYGGDGGTGLAGPSSFIDGGSAYGDPYGPMHPGSSGGGSYNGGVVSGSGGGLVVLRVDGGLTLDGSIRANGETGQVDIWSPPGSGAGGGVWVWADTITGQGNVQARGGDGMSGVSGRIGAGGGGGRVALFASSMTLTTSAVSVAAGALGSPPAEAGSLVVCTNLPSSPPDAPTIQGLLTPPATNMVQVPAITIRGSRSASSSIWFDDQAIVPVGSGDWCGTIRLRGDAMTVSYCARDVVGRSSPTNHLNFARDPAYTFITTDTHISAADTSYEHTALVIDGATVTLDGHHSLASLHLANEAVLTHSSAVTGLSLSVTGDLIVASNAGITVRGLGYPGGLGGSSYTSGYGPGGGIAQWYVGGGASHGGVGGTCSDGVGGGPVYGNETYPTTPGSGGGGSNKSGGGMPGGGCVWIKAEGGIALDGVIDASGVDYETPLYHGGGGGAGGSVLLCTPALSGSGSIDASGGDAHTFGRYGGGGGGGRVAIYASLDGFALTNVSVAGGIYGDPPATAGSVYHHDGLPAAVISSMSLSGYVTQTVESVTITFVTQLNAASVAAEDIIVSGPQACVVSDIARPDAVTVVASFEPGLASDGGYSVKVGPRIESFAGVAMDADGDGVSGEDPDDAATFTFTIDRTPPAIPVVTNFLALPDVNIVNTPLPLLAGTKDSDSSIWYDGRMAVPTGGASWSNRTPIGVGLSTVSLIARDPAGTVSAPTSLQFLCDMLEPRIVETTPADGATVPGQPAITVTCSDDASGPDLPNSYLEVSSAGAPVEGAWHHNGENRSAFSPAAALPDGDYAITVVARDQAGMEADPYVAAFQIVTPPPAYEELLPDWWQSEGVFDATPDDTNDFAALNAGQLRWAARCAAAAFDAHLPFGAGAAVNGLVDGFVNTQNFHAVNVGQLKAAAAPFYDQLGLALPWRAAAPTNDWALANVGQLKNLFDLPITEDLDGDGLPDWWEDEHFGGTAAHDGAGDADGDGLANIEEYQRQARPDAVDSDLDSFSDAVEVLYGSDPADASSFPVALSGSVSFADSYAGITHVVAATAANGWTGRRCEQVTLPSTYVISNAVSGRPTWIKAFLDANGNATCDAWEPVGVAAGAPHTLVMTTSGLDITLESPDLDGDGMPDIWEIVWFGSTLCSPGEDADGDGITNGDEHAQGTNPLSHELEQGAPFGGSESLPGDVGLQIFTPVE